MLENNIFSEEKRISYYQVGVNGRMMPAALLSELQDVAIDHSHHIGYPVDYMLSVDRGWAVVNWHIVIERMPNLAEDIKIETWCEKCRHMQALRCYNVKDEKGKPFIKAVSRWVFMDLAKRKPTAISKEMVERFAPNNESCLPGEKFVMPKAEYEPQTVRKLLITRRETDTNGHANNAKYMEWAMDDVPDEIYDGCALTDIRIVYRKECRKGDEVLLKTYTCKKDEGREAVTFITDESDTVLAEIATLWR